MPADKPVGSFDATLNDVAYPHAADLDTAWQYSDRADGVAFSDDYFSEIGGIQNDWLNAGGSAEDRTGYHIIGTDGSAKQVLVNRCVAAGASTYELGFVVRSTAGSNNIFIGLGDTGGNFNFNSVSLTDWENYLSGASNISLNGGSSLSVGDFVHGIYSSDGTSSVTLRVYVNEVFVGSTTGTLGAAVDFGTLASAAAEVNPESNYSIVFRNYYSSELSSGAADDNSGEPYATVGAVLSSPTVALSGTGAESSAVAADIRRGLTIASTGADASSVAVDLRSGLTISGTGADASVVSTDLRRGLAIEATGAEASAVGVDLRQGVALEATGAEASAVAVDIQAEVFGSVDLSGTGAEASAVSADLRLGLELQATGAEASAVTTDLRRGLALEATGAEASAVSVDIQAEIAGTVALSGTGAEASVVSTDLRRELVVAATGAEATATVINIARGLALQATGAEASAVTVDLDVETSAVTLVGTGAEAATTVVNIARAFALTATGAEASAVSVDLRQVTPGLRDIRSIEAGAYRAQSLAARGGVKRGGRL